MKQTDFDKDELDRAIARLKNNKSSGPNRVTSELIKLLDEMAREKLRSLLNKCWNNEQLFEEMNQADLAVIYKKGSTEKPENYRPIALLNIAYKLLASMIQVRLAEAIDGRIDPAQYGFRRARSTSQPVHIYRRIQEIHEESNMELVSVLLDWEKAFDKVHQGKLLEALSRIGIPDKMVRVIGAIYREPKFAVRDDGKRSTERKQEAGIRQGCPLSPYLFVIVMTVIMKDIDNGLTEAERQIMEEEAPFDMGSFGRLLYADDTIILASTAASAQLMLHKIQEESGRYNMRLNQTKCVLLRMNSIYNVYYQDGQALPIADRSNYLGTCMTAREIGRAHV